MFSKPEQIQLDKEIMSADFDQLLNEADELLTARSKTPESTATKTNALKNKYAPTVVKQEPELSDTDDFIRDLDLVLTPIQPNTPKTQKPAKPNIISYQHKFGGGLAGAGFFAQQKFCDALKAAMHETYSVKTTITKGHDNSNLEILVYIIEFRSEDEKKVNDAKKSLETLLQAVATKPVDDRAGNQISLEVFVQLTSWLITKCQYSDIGFWVKYPDCMRIVQAYSDQNEGLHILCGHETIGLMIYYFNKEKSDVFPKLCTSDAILDKIIQEKFRSLDIPLPSTSDLTKENKSLLAQDILKLENEMRHQNILMILEQRHIRLFGLVDIVDQVGKQIEKIKKKYASNTVKLDIEPEQIKYMLNIYNDELKALETNYRDAKIIETLENGEFTAPSYLHNTIEPEIMKFAILCAPIHFEIQEEAFRVIAHDECPNLIKIGRQYKCQIEIQEDIKNHICEIPKATIQDRVSNNLTAAAIKIDKGDLASQTVDLVVVCSTSMYLLDGILKKAGPSVKQEYTEAAKLPPSEPFEINSGQLLCRKLLFLSWNMDNSSQEAFYQSIRNFVTKAVQHAIKAHHTSIAFPAIGCGKLNFDKNVIANEMLIEAQKQLLAANVLLQIIFVILPKEDDVYKAFETKLESLQRGRIETKDTQISYTLTTLKITIISSNTKKQEECKKALNDYVQETTSLRELLQQDVLRKWTQPAINDFYKFCFSRRVILDMNITIGYLKLFGAKESVLQAETEYYREQTKQSEQARLDVIARNIIWAYKNDDSTSEKYSPELNARIEDAYSSKIPSFSYTDGKSEQFTIDFKTMIETCINKQTQCKVIRHADFNLPEHWAVQSENVTQFKVQVDSTEYKEILALFDKTMANGYAEILHIDRIQNKPWYIQYNSYKSFSPKKDTEQKLFHGCPSESARLIINSFFNRSFAGINGTVYGQGAYFSANALYSHGYAKANTLNGERCMFVANVLVGNTTNGNTNMKTPPPGYDSTTDGNHIFVTYRDDQAYAAYLIVYK